jgi:hypothetical protein
MINDWLKFRYVRRLPVDTVAKNNNKIKVVYWFALKHIHPACR